MCLSALFIFAGLDGPPAAAVRAPVLKWEKGGCFSSWCETGWYSSPAVADTGNSVAEINESNNKAAFIINLP